MSGETDFYKILEVPETADENEIKKAYRKLSLKYHPDKTNGNVESTELFKKVSEAYETLGDKEKRQAYDMRNQNPFMRFEHGGNNNINELFSNLFFGGMGPMGMGPMGPMGGFPPGANVQFFHNGVPVNMHQGFQKPPPITKTIMISMEQVLNGGKVPVEIERWTIENGHKVTEVVTMYVDIFKGIDDNEVLMIRDQGHVQNERCKGDVKLFIKIQNDTQFVRRGLDLILEKHIGLKDALCGFSFDIKYINGKVYTIHNQPGNIIPPEFQKTLPQMGLVRENHVGHLIIQFHVIFPTTLSLEVIEKLKEIL